MARSPDFRLLSRAAALLSLPLYLVACGGSDNGTEPDPPITILQLASQLNVAAGGDPLTGDTQKSISDLSADIATVMASKAFPAPPPVGEASSSTDALLAYDNVTTLLATTPARFDRFGDGTESPFSTLPTEAAFAFDGPRVLGVTCVWDVAADFWGGSPDIYGPVPSDGTRFEMYQTQPGSPIVPLQKLNTFVDVRPLVQASDPAKPGNVNAVISARNTSTQLVSVLLAGQSNPAANTLDLLMTGDVRTGGGSALNYLFSIDNSRAANVMEVGDILIIATLQATGGARGSMLVQKRDDPRQAVEFKFGLSANGAAITSGDVYVGSTRIGSIAGDRRIPVFTVTAQNFSEVDNLESIYNNVLTIDGGINELFFFAHCVGSDEPVPCQQMIQALLGTS